MSVRATNWAWEKARAGIVEGGELLTLLRLADHADNDGVCWPGQKQVAEFTGQDERTVRRHIKRLEERGLLEREKRVCGEGKGRLPDRIFLALDQPGNLSGRSQTTNRTLTSGRSGATNRTSDADQPDIDDTRSTYRNRKEPPKGLGGKKVNRKPVTEEEYNLAASIIDSFNEVAGTGFTVDAHLTPIVGRIRERPDLTAGHHRLLIEAVFRHNAWWDGPPAPEVIYGNARIFEKSLEVARAAARSKAKPQFDVNAEMDRIRREQGLED